MISWSKTHISKIYIYNKAWFTYYNSPKMTKSVKPECYFDDDSPDFFHVSITCWIFDCSYGPFFFEWKHSQAAKRKGNWAQQQSDKIIPWTIVSWLVVDLPLWKIWKSMGRIIPYIMENKIHVPDHQPVSLSIVDVGDSKLWQDRRVNVTGRLEN